MLDINLAQHRIRLITELVRKSSTYKRGLLSFIGDSVTI